MQGLIFYITKVFGFKGHLTSTQFISLPLELHGECLWLRVMRGLLEIGRASVVWLGNSGTAVSKRGKKKGLYWSPRSNELLILTVGEGYFFILFGHTVPISYQSQCCFSFIVYGPVLPYYGRISWFVCLWSLLSNDLPRGDRLTAVIALSIINQLPEVSVRRCLQSHPFSW